MKKLQGKKLLIIISICAAAGMTAGMLVKEKRGSGKEEELNVMQQRVPVASAAVSPSPSAAMETVDNSIWEDGVVNLLLIGTDEVYSEEDQGRGDAIMLCSLNRKTGSVKLVGFERSIGVPWPDHGDVMLTHSYAHGGAELTCEDISRCFRIHIDAYVQMDFSGFSQMIDAIGGVELELSAQEAQALTEDLYYEQWFSEGTSYLNGQAALRYCRLRRIDDNWNRVDRQRKLIQAVMKRGRELRFSQIWELLPVAADCISTNLSRAELAALLMASPRFLRAQPQQITVPDRSHIWTYDSGEETVTGCDFGAESRRLQLFLSEEETSY